MFCPKCGAKIEENARFCIKCGAPVAQAPANQNAPAPQAPVNQNTPAPQAPANAQSPVAGPIPLYMSVKDFTVFSYKFYIKNAAMQPIYSAETMLTAFFYKMHICDLSGRELIVVQQSKKITFAQMNFEVWKDGQLIAHITQKLTFGNYIHSIPELGLTTSGSIFATGFRIMRGNQVVAEIRKRLITMIDTYEILVYDHSMVEITLAFLMAVQMINIRNRHRR